MSTRMEGEIAYSIFDLNDDGNESLQIYESCHDICYLEQAKSTFRRLIDSVNNKTGTQLSPAEDEVFFEALSNYLYCKKSLEDRQQTNKIGSQLFSQHERRDSFVSYKREKVSTEVNLTKKYDKPCKEISPPSPELLNMWLHPHTERRGDSSSDDENENENGIKTTKQSHRLSF